MNPPRHGPIRSAGSFFASLVAVPIAQPSLAPARPGRSRCETDAKWEPRSRPQEGSSDPRHGRHNLLILLAESEGFEPPIPLRVLLISNQVPSAARPALRSPRGV